jgi:CheY-like chemotaxis protein
MMSGVLIKDYEVTTASSGLEALEMASRIPMPDLILLDIMMPGVDGRDVLRRLKGNPNTADIPIILDQDSLQNRRYVAPPAGVRHR